MAISECIRMQKPASYCDKIFKFATKWEKRVNVVGDKLEISTA